MDRLRRKSGKYATGAAEVHACCLARTPAGAPVLMAHFCIAAACAQVTFHFSFNNHKKGKLLPLAIQIILLQVLTLAHWL